jgi:hypothetical protein
MDITVELPPDPQRLLTATRVISRRSRLATRTLGVVATMLGAGIFALMCLGDGNGFELLWALALVVLGPAMFRQYDRAIARGLARRPVYAQDVCTVRLTDAEISVTYPQASLHVAWPAISKVVNTQGLWLFHSGWPVLLALPAASLGPTQAEELGAFLTERALLPAAA